MLRMYFNNLRLGHSYGEMPFDDAVDVILQTRFINI